MKIIVIPETQQTPLSLWPTKSKEYDNIQICKKYKQWKLLQNWSKENLKKLRISSLISYLTIMVSVRKENYPLVVQLLKKSAGIRKIACWEKCIIFYIEKLNTNPVIHQSLMRSPKIVFNPVKIQ